MRGILREKYKKDDDKQFVARKKKKSKKHNCPEKLIKYSVFKCKKCIKVEKGSYNL